MKICPNCGAENEGNALTCILCEFEFDTVPEEINESSGTDEAFEGIADDNIHTVSTDSTDRHVVTNADVSSVNGYQDTEILSISSSSGRSKGILIALVSLFVIAGGITGGVLLMKSKSKNTDTKSEKNSVITSESKKDNADATVSTVEHTSQITTISNTTSIITTEITQEVTTDTSTALPQSNVIRYPADDISKYSQYIKAIEDNITNYNNKMLYKGIYDINETGYDLCDLNNDNVPELVINAGDIDIYSIYNGEVVNLTPFYGGNMNKGTFVYETGHISMTGASGATNGMTYYIYNGGSELDVVDNLINDYSTDSRVITNNGIEISEEEYNNIISSYGEKIDFSSTSVINLLDIVSQPIIDKNTKSGFTFFDSSETVKAELTNYTLINEEDVISISNQQQHLVYYNYPSNGSINIILGLCFIDNRLVGVNFGFESFLYDPSDIWENIKSNIIAGYGQPDSFDTDILSWNVDPFGSGTHFFLYNYGNGIQLSYYPNEEKMSNEGLLPIDISKLPLTLE